MTLNDGRTLKVWLEGDSWRLRITGNEWFPDEESRHPIWVNKRPWDKLAGKWEIPDDEWIEFRRDVQAQAKEIEKDAREEGAQSEADLIPEDIQKVAIKISEQGKPLKFMLDTFNKTHKGDRSHAEAQFITFGLQSSYNTRGVFENWGGPSGKGKSDAAKACVRQLPSEYTIISSVTAKSLYRRAKESTILPGSVLFLDDKNIIEGSDLEETVKRIQTFFQEGAEHETIDGKGGYLKAKLPPRLLVIRTYISSKDSDEQLKNRSLDLGVDSSEEIDKEVCDLVLKLGEEGQTTDMVTRRILICRVLWRDIKSHVYRVKALGISQLVEFTDVSNRRNPSLFLDLVIGLACIHHRQRFSEEGPNGETILYAAYEDYQEAANLFNSQGDYLSTRLEKHEREAIQYIQEQGIDGTSIDGIFSHLSSKYPNDGWNKQKIRRLMDGRPERDIKGLVDKVTGIDTRWKSNDSGSKYKVYVMSCSINIGVKVTVHDPKTKITDTDLLSQLSHLFPKMGKQVNNNSRLTNPSSFPKYPKKENGDIIDDKVEGGDENKISPDLGKFGKIEGGNEPANSEKLPFPEGERSGISRIDADIQAHERIERETVEHFMKVANKYAKNLELSQGDAKKQDPSGKSVTPICPVCGDPVGTGYGTYTVYGRDYCASCGPKLPIVKASAKAMVSNGNRFTTGQIFDDLSMRGRPPLKKHLPAMLREIGLIEEGGLWRNPATASQSKPKVEV